MSFSTEIQPGVEPNPPRASDGFTLNHCMLRVKDPAVSLAFYTRVLGLVVTDRGSSSRGVNIAFLSRSADEHHQIALADGREKNSATTINQISFRVANLGDVRRCYQWLARQDVAKLDPRNHGNAWSVYFHDPEGNRIELWEPPASG